MPKTSVVASLVGLVVLACGLAMWGPARAADPSTACAPYAANWKAAQRRGDLSAMRIAAKQTAPVCRDLLAEEQGVLAIVGQPKAPPPKHAPQTVPTYPKVAQGAWTISIRCADAAVNETQVIFTNGRYFRDFGKGTTTLSMTFDSASEVHLVGQVLFSAAGQGLYPVNAIGKGANGAFSGVGTFGSETGCPFTALQQ